MTVAMEGRFREGGREAEKKEGRREKETERRFNNESIDQLVCLLTNWKAEGCRFILIYFESLMGDLGVFAC